MTYDSRPETYEHIALVRMYLDGFVVELLKRGQTHDATKLGDPELGMYNEFTPRLRNQTYGSKVYKETLGSMGAALEHHYRHNRHHPEHYAEGIRGMTLVDLVEMFCDWLASTRRHEDGDIRRSIEVGQERFGYSDELKQILLNTVDMVDPHLP